jgi:hypothetical protein
MSIISSTTGHNSREEVWIAKVLYVALAAAVIIALVTAFIASRSSHRLDSSFRNPTTVERLESPRK